jgi:hypothetical protein
MIDPDGETFKEIDKAYDRGRYQVMNYFVKLVEDENVLKDVNERDKEIVKIMVGIYKEELKRLEWVEQEMKEVNKILRKQ